MKKLITLLSILLFSAAWTPPVQNPGGHPPVDNVDLNKIITPLPPDKGIVTIPANPLSTQKQERFMYDYKQNLQKSIDLRGRQDEDKKFDFTIQGKCIGDHECSE